MRRDGWQWVFVGLLAIGGCAETVTFRSAPPGAKVFVDGGYVGVTPTTYSTQDVVPRNYRVEEEGFSTVEGSIVPQLAPGRVVGSIFTFGILAAYRPVHCYVPNPVNVALAPTCGPKAKLYNLNTTDVATGTCDSTGLCTVEFPSGMKCSGECVREHQGTTSVRSGATVTQDYGDGGSYGSATTGIAAGKEVENTEGGAAVLRCPGFVIDCALALDSFYPTGHGDCKDARGGRYKLMLLPK